MGVLMEKGIGTISEKKVKQEINTKVVEEDNKVEYHDDNEENNIHQLVNLIVERDYSKLYKPEKIIMKLNLNKADRNYLLLTLCFLGMSNSVKFLIEKGADVNFYSCREKGCENNIFYDFVQIGSTPIHETILGSEREENHTLKTLQLLLENGADPNKIGFSGLTPLQLSIVKNRPEHMGLLLLYGANPWTPSADMDKPNAFDFAEDSEWARFMLQRFSKNRRTMKDLKEWFPHIDSF